MEEIRDTFMAKAALFLWVPVSLAVFALVKKPHRAVAGLLIAAAILLPEKQMVTIKGLPNIDKKTIACAWVLIPMLLLHRRRLSGVRLGRLPWFLFGLMAFVDVMRALTNQDPMVIRSFHIPEIKSYTSITFILEHILIVFTPFYLGAALFRESVQLRELLKTFCVAGLCYVPLVAIELRLSPQLHNWIYGYLQHSWEQLLRGGGYRPMVFMEHGLALTLFLATAALCATGMSRAKERVWGVGPFPFALLLTAVVALCSSFGSLAYLMVLLPFVRFTSARLQMHVATTMAVVVLLYPLLRYSDLVPVKALVDYVASYSQDRAGSLDYRFVNESLALTHAVKRPLFGWGGFGRIFVYGEEGPNIIDGAWVIAYAEGGMLGFTAAFGLFFWPIWVAFRRLKLIRVPADKLLVSALALVTAMNVFDLLPNGMFTYFPYLLAGALLGATKNLSAPEGRRPIQPLASASPRPTRRAAV